MFGTFGQPQWIFAFCERSTTTSLLAEPLNVASNLVILIGAALLARRAVALRESGEVPVSARALVALMAVVGVASTVFHMAPMSWSLLLDAQAIKLFILWFVVCFARWMLGLPWRQALLAVPLFIGFAWFVRHGLPDFGLGISRFMPAALGLTVFTLMLIQRRDAAWPSFAGAAAAFVVALTFHRTDGALCGPLPTGTHFLWHLLSGLTMFLIAREVLERAAAAHRYRPIPISEGEHAVGGTADRTTA